MQVRTGSLICSHAVLFAHTRVHWTARMIGQSWSRLKILMWHFQIHQMNFDILYLKGEYAARSEGNVTCYFYYYFTWCHWRQESSPHSTRGHGRRCEWSAIWDHLVLGVTYGDKNSTMIMNLRTLLLVKLFILTSMSNVISLKWCQCIDMKGMIPRASLCCTRDNLRPGVCSSIDSSWPDIVFGLPLEL